MTGKGKCLAPVLRCPSLLPGLSCAGHNLSQLRREIFGGSVISGHGGVGNWTLEEQKAKEPRAASPRSAAVVSMPQKLLGSSISQLLGRIALPTDPVPRGPFCN